MHTIFTIPTAGPGLYEFTSSVTRWLDDMAGGLAGGDTGGLLTLFVRHTSCSLLIQENADPAVQDDLQGFFHRLVPPASDRSMGYLRHTAEGADDMPAHIKAAMLPVALTIPVAGGRAMLGTWQGLYLFEHRDAPHRRQVAARFMGAP